MICGGFVFSEAAIIITLNTKRGYWETINKLHVLSTALLLVYVITVIYSSIECPRSDHVCDLLWKVCSTLYISVSMAVYSFYYAKSTVVNNVLWKGKWWFRRVVFTMIPLMGLFGLCFFWLPFKDFEYYGFLKEGKCYLVKRRWILIFWVVGDVSLSILLLLLFIIPITVIKKTLKDTPRSLCTLRRMGKMTERNRNLLLFTVTVTISLFSIITVLGTLNMRTVICMGTIDRLVTLQCITMTFTYDGRKYFYCQACYILCFQKTPEIEHEQPVEYQAMSEQHVAFQTVPHSRSSTLLNISSSDLTAEN